MKQHVPLPGVDCPACGESHLSTESVVVFRPLVRAHEPGLHPLVGSVERSSFIEVEPQALRAIDLIAAHGRLDGAAQRLYEEAHTRVDLVDLVAYMAERDLVATIDACAIPGRRATRQGRHFAYVSPRAVEWMHHPFTLVSVLAVCFIGVAAGLLRSSPRLTIADLAPFQISALNLVALLAVLGVNLYLHELAHLFMARSYGIDATIKLGRRGPFIVLETDVTDAWLLPKRQRIVMFITGMGYNALAASLLFLASLGAPPFAAALLRLASLASALPLLFQLLLWMRTDLYFVLVALSGERNLHYDARAYVAYRWWRLRAARRGEVRALCPCGASRHDDDPFCLRCGVPHSPQDPNRFPFRAASRHLLLSFGLATLVLTPVVMLWGLHRTATLHWMYARRDVETLRDALASSQPLLAMVAGISLLLVATVIAVLGYLLLSSMRRRRMDVVGPVAAAVARPVVDAARAIATARRRDKGHARQMRRRRARDLAGRAR